MKSLNLKIIAAVLSVFMLTGLVTISAIENEGDDTAGNIKITEVVISNVKSPTVGEYADLSDAVLTTVPPNAATIKELSWSRRYNSRRIPPTEQFAYGYEYYALFVIVPNDGYCFEFEDDEQHNYTGSAVILNHNVDNAAERINIKGALYIDTDYEWATYNEEPKTVSIVNLCGIKRPVVNEIPECNVSIDPESPFKILDVSLTNKSCTKDITWYDTTEYKTITPDDIENGYTFKKDHKYRAKVIYDLNMVYDKWANPEDLVFLLDGKPAEQEGVTTSVEITTYLDPDRLTVFYFFPRLSEVYEAPVLEDDMIYFETDEFTLDPEDGIILTGTLKSGTLISREVVIVKAYKGEFEEKHNLQIRSLSVDSQEVSTASAGTRVSVCLGEPYGRDDKGNVRVYMISDESMIVGLDRRLPDTFGKVEGTFTMYDSTDTSKLTDITRWQRVTARLGNSDVSCLFTDLNGDSIQKGETRGNVLLGDFEHRVLIYDEQQFELSLGDTPIGIFTVTDKPYEPPVIPTETKPEETTAEPETSAPEETTSPESTTVPETTSTQEVTTATQIITTVPDSVTTTAATDPRDTSSTTAPHEELYTTGDADGNGKVNIKDATLIQKHVASIVELKGVNLKAADANLDGRVNVLDATKIQKFVAGIITKLGK